MEELLIIVEAFGHVNFGKNIYDPKGIVGNVYINGKVVSGNFIH